MTCMLSGGPGRNSPSAIPGAPTRCMGMRISGSARWHGHRAPAERGAGRKPPQMRKSVWRRRDSHLGQLSAAGSSSIATCCVCSRPASPSQMIPSRVVQPAFAFSGETFAFHCRLRLSYLCFFRVTRDALIAYLGSSHFSTTSLNFL